MPFGAGLIDERRSVASLGPLSIGGSPKIPAHWDEIVHLSNCHDEEEEEEEWQKKGPVVGLRSPKFPSVVRPAQGCRGETAFAFAEREACSGALVDQSPPGDRMALRVEESVLAGLQGEGKRAEESQDLH